MKFKAILFDLDGTLLDTLGDLADSANAALARFGFAGHPVEAYKIFVGDGMDSLVRRILPEDKLDEETISKCLAIVKAEYGKRWAAKTKPYPGIPQLLDSLDEMGISKVIFSNKPDEFTQLTVNKLLCDWKFEIVRGVSETVAKKPDPAGAIQIADDMRIDVSDFVYLGDTNTDMQTANAAGMFAVGALWGFREADELKNDGAKELVGMPGEVLKFFCS